MSSARTGNEARQSICQPVSPSGTCPVERRAKTESSQDSQFVEPRQLESSQDSHLVEPKQSVCRARTFSVSSQDSQSRAKTVKSRAKTVILSSQNNQFVEPRQSVCRTKTGQSRAKTARIEPRQLGCQSISRLGTCPAISSRNRYFAVDRLEVGWFNGFSSRRGAARAEDPQGTPTRGHMSPSILVHEDYIERSHGPARISGRDVPP